MKKIFILLALSFVSNLFAQTSEVVNGTIIDNITRDNHSLVIRKHEQTLTIDWAAESYSLILYDDPIKKNKIEDLHRKQEINIKQLIFVDGKKTWMKIQVNDKEGYILYSNRIDDPYKDNSWMPAGTIKSENKTFHILKCKQGFIVQTNLRIRDKPGLEGNKIGLIVASTGSDNWAFVSTIEVTKEKETIDNMTERWAKIEYKGITGWVFGGYLEMERGGPRFNAPENIIELTLGEGV